MYEEIIENNNKHYSLIQIPKSGFVNEHFS